MLTGETKRVGDSSLSFIQRQEGDAPPIRGEEQSTGQMPQISSFDSTRGQDLLELLRQRAVWMNPVESGSQLRDLGVHTLTGNRRA